MKIRYDKEANAAYIYFSKDRKATKTVPVDDDIAVDFGSKGKVIGVEVLNARAHIPRNDLIRAISHRINIPIMRLI
jgi:uncharacterized protein YuzE